MRRFTSFVWAAVALLIALTIAYPVISAAFKILAVAAGVIVLIVIVVWVAKMFIGGGPGRLMR